MKKAVVLALAAMMLLGVAGAAFADSVAHPGALVAGKQVASGPVAVKAQVNPKISLTITTPDDPQTVDFGLVDPATTYTESVTLAVKSNKAWTMQALESGDAAITDNLTLTAPATVFGANYGLKGEWSGTDTYTLNMPWTVEAGVPYTASVLYTVTQ